MSLRNREITAPGNIKGSLLRAHLSYCEEQKGPRALTEILARLPEEVRSRLERPIMASSWYPFEHLILLDKAIAAYDGGVAEATWIELGRYSAQKNLASLQTVLQQRRPHDFFQRTAMLHRQFQNFGEVEYRVISDGEGHMVHSGYASFSPVYCASGRGYYAEILEQHGFARVEVDEVECQCAGDATCTFTFRWR